MTFPGYYDASYPPALWQTTTAPVAAARPVGADGAPAATFMVAAGAPGSYGDDVKPADRPRNITDLDERATPADSAPWAAGEYVPVGERGKRAHWTGQQWRTGESPGYPAADLQEESGTVPPGTVQ